MGKKSAGEQIPLDELFCFMRMGVTGPYDKNVFDPIIKLGGEEVKTGHTCTVCGKGMMRQNGVHNRTVVYGYLLCNICAKWLGEYAVERGLRIGISNSRWVIKE
jgi:hypothetical protein